MIFGTQLCKWILIILVNLLRCVPCPHVSTSTCPRATSLTWWRNVYVTEIMPFTVHMTLSVCHHAAERERETPDFITPEMLTPNSSDLIPVDYKFTASRVSFKWGSTVRGSTMWRSWNVCWWSGGCWTTPSSRQRLRNGVVVWIHVFAWMVDILNINVEPLTSCCVQ